jgi:hypothetical protein
MTDVCFGLISTKGDRFGHLVRGVQMLRSYGSEAHIEEYSDVVNVASSADEPSALCCVLRGETDATADGLQGICREVQWALGEDPNVLTAVVLRLDGKDSEHVPRALQAVLQAHLRNDMAVFMPENDFAEMCDWGQQLLDGDDDVMGEWPSATGP